ncbi:MAG: tetratricopeptide repeat protein [Myxococcaceae bacterium]|jgi:tetratricopeptide (TPR) repeat protein|nr:tetratricopeptide repeat protein [Myxococcaceae bacterium]
MRRPIGLVVVLCGALAAAQAPSPEVTKYLQAATTLYENLEYTKALAQLRKARTKAKSPDDEARCAVLEGIVLADMGKDEQATAAFTEAFGLDPDLKLPVAVAPKINALAERVRDQVKKTLAPTLAAQRAAEEKRQADERARAEAERADAERRKAEALATAQREDEERRLALLPPPAVAKAAAPVRGWAWLPGAVGLVAGGVATFCFAEAGGRHAALLRADASVTTTEAQALRDSGRSLAMLGSVFTGLSVAGLGAALVMFLVGAPPAPTSVSLFASPSGGGVSVSGAFEWPGGVR